MFLSIGRLGATTCKVVSSTTYAKSVTDKWKTIPAGTESPYYDATCKCYKEGYRPYGYVLYGVTPTPAPHIDAPWNVCVPTTTAPAPTTCPTCPACKACPSCPTCPKCPVCPTVPPAPAPVSCPVCDTCPTCPAVTGEESALSKYGPTLGWLLALAVVGGGGYYAYKKGAFGKKKR